MQNVLAGLWRSRFWLQVACGLAALHLALVADRVQAQEVKEQLIRAGQGLPVETLIMSPDQVATEPLPVLVMNHGFLMSQRNYRELMAETVKAGFVILAPQTHAAGGLPFGKPTTDREAQLTADVIRWFSSRLAGLVGQEVDFERLGLLNHSRGSKIAWTLVRDNLVSVKAIAAIDPVDGNQDGSPRVTGGSFRLRVPVLIIGSGLGGSCAPSDRNYNSFWASLEASPSWLYVAQDFGHLDMLDNSNCGLHCSVCTKAPATQSRTELKDWIGQSIGQFMRGILLKDNGALEQLEATPTGIRITRQKR